MFLRSIFAVGVMTALSLNPVSAFPQQPQASNCNQPTPEPIVHVPMPGNPFQAIATPDGCYILVSLPSLTAPEPGGMRNPTPTSRDSGITGGIAVVRRAGGEASIMRVVTIRGSPWGMVLTHDGKLLIVADDDRAAFIDVAELLSGAEHPSISYLRDAKLGGRVYVNVTQDDRYVFLSDETIGSITVVDLARARATGFDSTVVIGRIPVGKSPIALQFSADQRLLYTTSEAARGAENWPVVCEPEGKSTQRHPQGAILVVDLQRAVSTPANSIVGVMPAGCSPVRLVTSPTGDIAYVTARRDNALLVFDTRKLLADTAHALIGRVPLGIAPVGVAVVDNGKKVIVGISNRFSGAATDQQVLTVIDASRVSQGAAAILGNIPAGAFPRELRVTADQQTLLLTNYASKTLEIIDLARMPLQR